MTACRTRPRPSRSTSGSPFATRSSTRASGRRGGRLRLAEVGAADGGLRRGAATASVEARRASACRCSCRTARASSRARAAGAREIAVFTAASETLQPAEHRTRSIDETFARFARVRARGAARRACACAATSRPASAVRTRAPVAPAKVVDVARRLVDVGCDEVSIGDTIGVAVPTQVSDVDGPSPRCELRRGAWRCTSTTPAARRSPTCSPRCRRGSRSSTAPPAVSAAARTLRAPAGTSRPRICCTCSTAWASRPASTSRGGGGVARGGAPARPDPAQPLPAGVRPVVATS